MTKPVVIASGLILAFAAVPAARAQVTLDVSKVMCDQYTGHKVTNAQNIAIWLSANAVTRRSTPKDSSRMRKSCEAIAFAILKRWS
jgi:acid stress chaperone HdeB